MNFWSRITAVSRGDELCRWVRFPVRSARADREY
jgi:hypothetical protein